jgi:hypothetical protein
MADSKPATLDPTGFPGMVAGTIPFNPQPPQNQNQNHTAPANVFAQMKAGTFAQNNDSAAQNPERYDALRPNRELAVFVTLIAGYDLSLPPLALAAQPTGWFPGPGTYGSF